MQADQVIQCNTKIGGVTSVVNNSTNLNSRNNSTKGLYEQDEKSLREKIMEFYYKEFDKITKKYTRGKILSFVIFSAFQLQQISLLYNTQVQDRLSSNSNENIPSQLYKLISYVRIEPLIQDLINLNSSISDKNTSKQICLTFLLFFSLLFCTHLSLRLIAYLFKDDTSQIKSRPPPSKFGSGAFSFLAKAKNLMLQENYNLVFDSLASFYYQLILFLFFIPSTQIFSEIYNDQISNYGFTLAAMSFLNMILHLIIVFIYVIHDYNYEIAYSDHLSKRDSLWGLFHIISVGTMATFYNTQWGLGISTIHWVLKCLEMFELYLEFPYYDDLIRYWNCLFIFLHFSFSFIAYLFMFMDLRQNCNISMIYLLIIPLACQIGDFVFMKLEKKVKEEYKHSENPIQLDQYIRFLNKLYDLDYNKYTQLKYGVDFEQIYTDHITSCSDFKCFCSEYQYKPFKWENFIQSDDRSYFLQNYIVKLLEGQNILQSNKNNHAANRLRFSYLQFLIEKVPNPTKAFTQIIQIMNDKNFISVKEYYVLHIIMRRCQQSYRQFFIDSTYQNQRLPMMAIISFDNILDTSINIFKDVLYDVRSFYNFLCQDLINLDQLFQIGEKLVKKRCILEQNIKLLFDINPRNDYLYGLAEGYAQLLDLKSRRVKQFKKKSMDLLHANRLKHDLEINLTSKNSCIVYISLQQQGQIKKLTHSFQSLFGLPIKNMIGKPVDAIMPDIFCENHDKYIQKFVEKGTTESMNKVKTNMFGKNSLGFIFPITLRLRLNYIGYEDFGVCGHITKITDNSSEFIMLDKDLNISDVSRRFYKRTFENVFEDQKALCKKIHLTRIIPLIGCYIEENFFNKESFIESTMMIIPISNRQVSFFKKRNPHKKDNMQKFLKELGPSRFNYYQVSLQLQIIKSTYGNVYRVIEIKYMKQLKKNIQKSQLMQEFVECYNKSFSANVCYIEPSNSSSRYFETGTVIDQSQLNNSSISASSYKQQSIKKQKTSKRTTDQNLSNQNVDLFPNFKKVQTNGGEMSVSSINKLITSPLKFETIIGVRRLIKKFVRNLYTSINKRRSSRNILLHQNDFYMPNITLQKYSSVDTTEYSNHMQKGQNSEIQFESPILQQNQSSGIDNKRNSVLLKFGPQIHSQNINSPSSLQLQKVPSNSFQNNSTSQYKKDSFINGKPAHKKSSFLKSYQQIDNQVIDQDVINQYKDEGNLSTSNFPESTNIRAYQQAMSNDDHYPYFGVLNSPNPSEMPLNPYSTSPKFDFSNTYQNGQQDYQLNSIDRYFNYESINNYQRNEGKENSSNTQFHNNEEDTISPSTKIPSSTIYQNTSTNKKFGSLNEDKIPNFQQPINCHRDMSSTLVPEDGTQILSANQLVQFKQDNQQQKFYDKIESSDFNKMQTVSLIETISPNKKFHLKKYSVNYLQLVKESQYENSKNVKNRQSIADQFEKDFDQDEDDEKSGTRRTRNRKGTETIFEGENKRKRKEINDQQSVNSAMSQTYSKKIQVIESITTTSKPLLILFIQLAGIAAFLFMVTVTSGIFIYLNTIFKDNVSDFNNLLVGPQLQSDYSYLMKEKEVLNLMSIPSLTPLFDPNPRIQGNLSKLLESYKIGAQKLFEERSGASFSVRVNHEYMTVDYFLLPNRENILDYRDESYPMKFLINYSALVLITHLQAYINIAYKFMNSLRYVEKNLVVYFSEYQTIEELTRKNSLDEVKNMETNIITSIGIMEGVAFLVMIIVIPIYSKIQTSRENWLKLFATWPQSKLQELSRNIDSYITEEYGTLKQLERQTNNKRKTVSSTTFLKKINWSIFFYIFICLILVSIYPIINLIFTQDFVKEFNYSIKEINSIITTRSQLNSEFAISLLCARKKYQGVDLKSDNFQYYLNIHKKNAEIIQDLYQLTEHFSSRRYQKSMYEDFLLASLNENACDTFITHQEYFFENSNIDMITCKTIYKNILMKGIIPTLKEIQIQFGNLQEIVLTSKQFNVDFQTWVKDAKLNELIEVQRQLSDYLKVLQIFLMTMIEDYKDYIATIQFWLYLYSLFVLVTIFLIGFNYFVKKLNDSLFQTRYLMTLFKVDTLLENSYIMSFLSDELSKGRLK